MFWIYTRHEFGFRSEAGPCFYRTCSTYPTPTTILYTYVPLILRKLYKKGNVWEKAIKLARAQDILCSSLIDWVVRLNPELTHSTAFIPNNWSLKKKSLNFEVLALETLHTWSKWPSKEDEKSELIDNQHNNWWVADKMHLSLTWQGRTIQLCCTM